MRVLINIWLFVDSVSAKRTENQVIFTELLPVTVFCCLTSNLKLLTTACGVKYCCNQFSPREATATPFSVNLIKNNG